MSSWVVYLLIVAPALFTWYAQSRVKDTYRRYEEQRTSSGLSGLETAKRLLAHTRLFDVTVERTPGNLTDHYDPTTNTLRLSDGVAGGRSITSAGVVAHEVGHAIQDAEDYRLMQVRIRIGTHLGRLSQWSSLIFIGGMLFGLPIFMALGGLLLAVLVLFSLVTLPLERDASTRALALLTDTGLVEGAAERAAVQSVLRAAAFTYAAGLGRQLANFLFFVFVIVVARGI